MSIAIIVTKILEVIPQKSSAVINKSSAVFDAFGGVTDWYSEPRL